MEAVGKTSVEALELAQDFEFALVEIQGALLHFELKLPGWLYLLPVGHALAEMWVQFHKVLIVVKVEVAQGLGVEQALGMEYLMEFVQ